MKVKRVSTFMILTFLIFFLSLPAFGGSVQYTYDANNRLIRAEYDNGAVVDYTYDAAGNWTTKTVSPVTVETCEGNANGDDDVDGSDLAAFAHAFDASRLAAFAADFGRTDCQ